MKTVVFSAKAAAAALDLWLSVAKERRFICLEDILHAALGDPSGKHVA